LLFYLFTLLNSCLVFELQKYKKNVEQLLLPHLFTPYYIIFNKYSTSILGQNATHFGPKRIPFCGKTQPILRQNAFHFAAKRNPFCGKTHFIMGQTMRQ